MTDNSAIDRIKTDVEGNDVVLFMKGTPMFPQCGFSAAVVQILSQLDVKFKGVDVLESDPAVVHRHFVLEEQLAHEALHLDQHALLV